MLRRRNPVEAAYSPRKAALLARANRDIEVLRWLVRMATDRKVLTPRQCEHCCLSLASRVRADGRWVVEAGNDQERAVDAPREEPL